jgi:hypothetical protein
MTNNYLKKTWLLSLKALTLLVVLLVTGKQSYGSHAAGADLTYRWLQGNTYEVTAAFYRDCGGINEPSTVTLNYFSQSCGYNMNATLQKVNNGPVITYPCNSAVTTCSGGTTPGIQQWLYRGNITLPAACSDWKLSYSVTARNCVITTIVQPVPCNSSTSYEPIYVEALLNNVAAPNNSSPTFSNVPISFVCLGQGFNYNHGVIDPDADSLSYQLITPLTGATTTVTYLPGYSATNPIASSPAFSINPVTGDLFMTPTMLEVSVVAVKVNEYRNGVLIGSVIRDMQIYSRNCTPNIVPSATGINGTNNFTAKICAGESLCFDIFSSDANSGDVVNMTWNSIIPGATFNATGSPYPTGEFCWTPQPSDARDQPYTFTVTVRDDACPLNGLQTYSYSIYVSNIGANAVQTDLNGFGVSCLGDVNGTMNAVPTGGILPFTYLWGDGSTTQSIGNLAPGSYTVTVTDSIGCSVTVSGNITEPTTVGASITGTVNPECGQNNGSATAAGNGGAGGYQYLWSDSQTGATATGLAAGAYTVVVTDANGCSTIAQANLTNEGGNYYEELNETICEGASFELPNGNVVTDAGTYTSSFTTVNGCDSVIVVNLSVIPAATTQIYYSICEGESYGLSNGLFVDETGVYYDTLQSSSGCDSILVINLTVNPHVNITVNASICSGQSFLLPNGQSVTQGGVYVNNFKTVAGCDSIITTNLTVLVIGNPTVTASGPLSFCPGGSVTLTSSPALSYQWLKNGVAIGGATSASYIATNAGTYKVRVNTACGIRTSGPVVVVKYALPILSTSPTGTVEICSYDSLLITATVVGTDPVTYQWFKNNVAINGANSSTYYATSAGSYKVRVVNQVTGCQRTSAVTKVNKTFFTASLTHDISLVVCLDPVTFTINTTAANPTFTWYRSGNVLQGVNGNTYSTVMPGNYKVLVTDVNGCTKMSNVHKVTVDCDNVNPVRVIATSFEIYPNPTSGNFFIEKTDGSSGELSAEIIDITGRVVHSVSFGVVEPGTSLQVEVNNLARGIYYVRLSDSENISAKRLIIK